MKSPAHNRERAYDTRRTKIQAAEAYQRIVDRPGTNLERRLKNLMKTYAGTKAAGWAKRELARDPRTP